MNSLRRRIDRFCVLHPNFGIPNLMLYIVIGNIAFYLLSLFSTLDGGSFYSILSFSWAGLKQGQLWRLLSFSFLPTDTRPFWLLMSCYFYYWIGSTLEREWGTAKFTIYYLSGVLLTALGAVAACDAVERTCGVRPQIKWTNDLVLNGKKLSGTLTELSLEGESGALQYAVIGIGVNCNNTLEDFPPELRDVATSLYLETGKRVQRAALAAALIEELDKLYAALQSGDTASYLTSYRRDCLTLGREVQLLWQDVKEKVTALDVDDQFGLVVRRADGTVETIRTGEVSVRGLYGYVE